MVINKIISNQICIFLIILLVNIITQVELNPASEKILLREKREDAENVTIANSTLTEHNNSTLNESTPIEKVVTQNVSSNISSTSQTTLNLNSTTPGISNNQNSTNPTLNSTFTTTSESVDSTTTTSSTFSTTQTTTPTTTPEAKPTEAAKEEKKDENDNAEDKKDDPNDTADEKEVDDFEGGDEEDDENDDKKDTNLEPPANLEKIRNQPFQDQKKFSYDDDESSTGFLTYFLVISGICITIYVAYHNKAKILGLVIEGRNRGTQRRFNSRLYNKIENVQDAMPNAN